MHVVIPSSKLRSPVAELIQRQNWVHDFGVAARENAMTELMSEEEQSARDESETFDKGPLTARENRIMVDGGVAIPIPGLIRHIEKVLNSNRPVISS